MILKSVNLWLDEKGFHGMKYGMEIPDLSPDMCITHKALPSEAYLYMSPEDKKRVSNFLKGMK